MSDGLLVCIRVIANISFLELIVNNRLTLCVAWLLVFTASILADLVF